MFEMFDAEFKVESSGGGQFLRLPTEDGKFVRFAVLGKVTNGFVYWNNQKRTVNLREKPKETPADIRVDGKYPDRVKQFIAFPGYDYETKAVVVVMIEQASVINAIFQLVTSGDVDPTSQFFKVNRMKVGGKTEYQVVGINFKNDCPKPDDEAYAKAAEMNLDDILFRTPTQGSEDDAAVDVAKAAEIM